VIEYLKEMDYQFDGNGKSMPMVVDEVIPKPPKPQPQLTRKARKYARKFRKYSKKKANLEFALSKYNTSVQDITRKLDTMNPLRILGGYISPEQKHFNGFPRSRPYYKTPILGFQKNPGFCDIVDNYNLFNPDNVYNQMNFLADYIPRSKYFVVYSHLRPCQKEGHESYWA
jgi:hypothetical protein